MKFRELARYLDRLQKTPSRLVMTDILAELFGKLEADEIDKATYLLSGKLAPNYTGIEFNMAEKTMIQVIAKACDIDNEKIKEAYKQKGDLGEVARAFANSKGKDLEILEVYRRMLDAAEESGPGSVDRKIDKMSKLFKDLDPLSTSFIVKIPIGNLRLGFSDMTVLDALSVATKGDKSARGEIENAFNVNVDLGKVARRVKVEGLTGLKELEPEPGTPIRPSLAERLLSAEKILEKIGPTVAVEPKYDGFRAQVHIYHKDGKKVINIYSRNLENTTHMFPDLVKAFEEVDVESGIFDGEAIGINTETGKFLPFQETVQRKRKHGIEEASQRLPLKYFVFDVLFKNGKSFLSLPFNERRKILEQTFSKNNPKVEITRQVITSSAKEIRDLIQEYLKEGLEGAMVKKIDAAYKAGGRGYHWVKYKKTTEEGVADTIDCLVMGTYVGKGKRVGFGAGAFLVGVKDGETFKTVSKIGTGLTDEQWRELNSRASKLTVKDVPEEFIVPKNLEPNVWTRASLVVEILADEITRSPLHSSGLALRFPRLIRFRDEKAPGDTTSIKELNKLFKMQKSF
ncbi:ATP-dependent DNA ligase [Candidatus Woesebacteria bacterium]|nr:ATP-dependent DNA ligase [Candidatus Woesebacteria bacterium]